MKISDIGSSPKIIYFDHKGWIDLAKIYYGKPSINEKEVLCKIETASKNETAIFPISMINFSETHTIRKTKWRHQLASIMSKISKSYTLTPHWTYVLDIEVKNLVLETLGLPTLDVRKYWLGKGVSHLMDQEPTIVSESMDHDVLRKINQQIRDLLKSETTLELLLKEYSRDESMELEHIKSVHEFERIRKNLQKISDNDLRREFFMIQNTSATIVPRIIKTLIEFNLPKEFIDLIIPKGDIEKLLSKLPTALCEFTLLFQRDQQLQRPIEVNDIADLWHLTLAIPYSDIVITENMWVSIAKQAKLDKKCNTIILSSINELIDFL